MFRNQGKNPPPSRKSSQSHPHTYWIRFGIAGAAALALMALLLLSSFAHTGRAATVMAPTIAKSSVTSIVDTNNTIGQAVAGEIVTVTVEFTVPSGETIYDASPRVLLQDGLLPLSSDPAWAAMHTGTTTALRAYETLAARNGALVIFPTQATVTGPATLTRVVRAVRTQYQYVGSNEIGTTNLRVQAVLRYCESSSGCPTTVTVADDTTGAQVGAILPQVNTAYETAYLDAAGVGAGGGQVRLTFTATGATGRPAAHDIVYTATLGSGLSYSASSGGNGAGAGTVSSGPNGVTYVKWNVPISLVAPNSWQAVVTATLPSTLVIGREFTAQGTATYETFDGDMDNEGVYTTAGAVNTLRPGLSVVTKSSNPGSGAVTMGDEVAYTVVFKQGANTTLQAPQVVDTQPLGFHYVPDSLVVQNATVNSVTTAQGVAEGTGTATRYYEALTWVMNDLPVSTQSRVITATYSALNTG